MNAMSFPWVHVTDLSMLHASYASSFYKCDCITLKDTNAFAEDCCRLSAQNLGISYEELAQKFRERNSEFYALQSQMYEGTNWYRRDDKGLDPTLNQLLRTLWVPEVAWLQLEPIHKVRDCRDRYKALTVEEQAEFLKMIGK